MAPARHLLFLSRTDSFLTSDANERAKSLLDRLDQVGASHGKDGKALFPRCRSIPGERSEQSPRGGSLLPVPPLTSPGRVATVLPGSTAPKQAHSRPTNYPTPIPVPSPSPSPIAPAVTTNLSAPTTTFHPDLHPSSLQGQCNQRHSQRSSMSVEHERDATRASGELSAFSLEGAFTELSTS